MKKKRSMMNELIQGIEDMQQHRKGKITLRTHEIEVLPPLEIDKKTIRRIRKSFNLSQAVFARYLRVSEKTFKNWEQGRTKPNSQAAALILMVGHFPDTIEKLQRLGSKAA